MYNEINKGLEEAQQGICRLDKIDSMLRDLENERLSLERRLSELKEALDKENLDVDKLENRSLSNIFYTVLGRLPEHLEKERGEALAAKLKYDRAALDLEDVRQEISKLNAERVKYNDCRREYDSLYAQKKDLLIKSDPEKAQYLLGFTEQLAVSKNRLKEIREAVSAGRDAIISLDRALGSLDSAAGWGTWDMLGGGLLSDLAKHSHIDAARDEAEQAQTLLRRFRTELADIKIDSDICIEIDGFAKFADFFFDGLIADWFMQSKIRNSSDSVAQVRNQVEYVLEELSRMEGQEASNIDKLESDMNDLITKA